MSIKQDKIKKSKKKAILIVSLCLLFVFLVIGLLEIVKKPLMSVIYKNYTTATPTVLSKWTELPLFNVEGDIYVSKHGADDNTGTKTDPFLTISRAIQEVKSIDKTGKDKIVVCINAGEYNIDPLEFNSQAGGNENCKVIYTAYNGEVRLNAGITLNQSDFASVNNYSYIADRLSSKAKENVMVVDLMSEPYKLSSSDWGQLYTVGTYNTADRYTGQTTGAMYSELFINDERQSLARYPNNGYIYTDKVVSVGKNSNNKANGDPAGDVYKVNDNLAKRIANWKNPQDVWMYGFWQYDWADGSTPIESFDKNTNNLTTKYQSFFGTKENAPYYFYNCLEELDSEGEWYLDRDTGLLCIYKPKNFNNSQITLSLLQKTAITINASNITFNGFTITGTRGNGIEIYGNNNVIENCKVVGIGGHAIIANGYNNKIVKNEVSNIGKGGVATTGGDRTTLTSGNNIIKNNLIHDWAQIFRTYQAGINVGGVGNICANNELYNSSHLAITYDGNKHIFEYNLIHDVCLETDDAGAIYAGRSWSSYGNDIRYNLIYNLGANGFSPNGIYMDDAISGQNIYGNILINIPKHAIFIGGGRDINVYDNIIINSKDCAIRYDARARDGILQNTWFSEHVNKTSGDLWKDLYYSPWQSDIWQQAFPQYKNISTDFSDINEKNFMANPSNSNVKNNIIFDKAHNIGNFDNAVTEFSNVQDNKVYYLCHLKKAFKNYQQGDYSVSNNSIIYKYIPNFDSQFFQKIGRF